jgi:hypothetical protein
MCIHILVGSKDHLGNIAEKAKNVVSTLHICKKIDIPTHSSARVSLTPLVPDTLFTSTNPSKAFVEEATSSSQGQLVRNLALWKSIPETSVLLGIPFHKTRLLCRLRIPRQTPVEVSDGNELEASDGIAVTVVVTVITVVLPLIADPVSSPQSISLVSGIPEWRIRCHYRTQKESGPNSVS